jgi:hypothetical protein
LIILHYNSEKTIDYNPGCPRAEEIALSQTKRVLMITYHFPPSPAVGGLRTVKFAKFLPEYGWEPLILTVTPEDYDKVSEASMAMIPANARIDRIPMWPSPRQMYLRLKGTKGSDVSNKQKTFINEKIQTSTSAERKESLKECIKRYIFSLMWIPDDIQGWYPPAVRAGKQLIREAGIDAIISSAPPSPATGSAENSASKQACPGWPISGTPGPGIPGNLIGWFRIFQNASSAGWKKMRCTRPPGLFATLAG